jgi:RNA polymerase sigma-70 factor (ECF subfamily)
VTQPDDAVFAAQLERHRAELRVHCYRMLGSFEDAEDLVQETFLRAWRGRERFGADGRLEFRAWLYRIATNACLDVLRRRPRRVMPEQVAPAADPDTPIPPPEDLPWLQPYPDRLLPEPDELVIARETLELGFLAAIQHLPPRQRAVLILRELLGWPAKETAVLLEASVAAVNSALQRARATLREQLGERLEWTRAAGSSDAERRLLDRYLEAHERQDVDGLAALLREDARLTMPPHAVWFDGRAAIVHASAKGFDPDFGELRGARTGANLQPAVGWYLRPPGGDSFEPLAFDVLRIEDGAIATITSFVLPDLFAELGLPARL